MKAPALLHRIGCWEQDYLSYEGRKVQVKKCDAFSIEGFAEEEHASEK